jgi:hypothetical protein
LETQEQTKTVTSGTAEGFDLRTEVREARTNAVLKRQDYRMKISKDEGTLFERPINSGKWYNIHNQIVKDTSVKQVTTEKSK